VWKKILKFFSSKIRQTISKENKEYFWKSYILICRVEILLKFINPKKKKKKTVIRSQDTTTQGEEK
jgi:hypothetical protein